MSPEAKGMLEWLAGGGLLLILGYVVKLDRRQTTMNESMLLIRGAIIGYEGKGGLEGRVTDLEARDQTVDERITKAKHDARNQAVDRFNEAELQLTRRCDDHEGRLRALEQAPDRRHKPRAGD